jgi:GNAT superfamily N-acetyltransferase
MRARDIYEAKLPGRVAKLLNHSLPIVLKDGRHGELLITRGSHDGLTITATVDTQIVGSLSIYPNQVPDPHDDIDLYADDRGSWSVASLHVDDAIRRQGVATAMYDALAKAGLKILPSGQGYGGKLLPNGADLWQSNRPAPRLGQKPKLQRFWKPKK